MTDQSSPLPPHTMEHSQNVSLLVALRIRPFTQEEMVKGATQVAYPVDDKMVVLLDPGDNLDDVLRQKRSREKRFVFDVAFGPEATQEEVYERTTRHLIENVVNGYNATVFAYGATGAGKTYTMIGTEMNHGIMARAMNELFKKIQHEQENSAYAVKMSYLEIYNELIRDLMQPSSGFLDVREDSKGGIQVVGLTETSTTSSEEVMQLLMEGNKRRTQEPTAANKTSSRSHAILQVTVTQRSRLRGTKSVNHIGKLFLIDLAGSERASHTQNTGLRLKEGAHINRSLLALGNVINTLAEKGARFVNYRDSKLTRLLKDSLGGNSRTVMIANISPTSAQFEESRNTLIYADRAKNISTKIARNNQDVTYHVTQYQAIISELRKEIARLKMKIDEQNGLPIGNGLLRSESALSFLRDKPSLIGNTNVKDNYATTDRLPLISSKGQSHQSLSNEFYRLKDEMNQVFRSQMQLRQKLLSINEKAFDLAISLSDKRRDLNDESLDDQQSKLLREIETLEKKLKDLDHQRAETEWDLSLNQKKAAQIEEALPQKISAKEEKEMLNYFARLHAAEIEKITLQSDAMILQRRLKRQESSIRRLRDYHNAADHVISSQQDLIEVARLEYPQRLRVAMDEYQTKRRNAERVLEPLGNRPNVTTNGHPNKSDLDRDRSLYERRALNKTLNASELQTLKRMASMLERERSDVNVSYHTMKRPGSAGSLAQLPIVEAGDVPQKPIFAARPRTMTDTNLRRSSELSLMDIRTVARERRSVAFGNGVSWKNPVATVAFTPGTPDTVSTDSTISTTDLASQMTKKVPTGRRPTKPGPLTPIGVPTGAGRTSKNSQRRSKSRRKAKSMERSRANSVSPIGPNTQRPNVISISNNHNSNTNQRRPSNPNRRVRSPTPARLPVIR